MLVLYVLLNLASDLITPQSSQKGMMPSRSFTSRYDCYFQKYTRTYFGRFSWRLFKAQAIQESSLNAEARSRVGAVGLMQLMPSTYGEIRRKIHLGPNPARPADNIHAGIYYDLQCINEWNERRGMWERIRLMLASYNAGMGNILAAQRRVRERKRCKGITWESIQQGLPQVTGAHAEETINYVERVELYYEQL